MQPLEVHGVDGVLLALEPVAGNLREHDLDEAVLPGERLPGRHQGRRRRAEIGPEQPALGLHGIGGELDAVLVPGLRMGDLLERLGQALAGLAVEPAVVVTAQAAVFDDAVGEVGPTVGTVPIEKAERAAPVTVEDEILAEQAHGLDWPVLELAHRGEGHPVPPQELAHAGARADFGQSPVLLLTQHGRRVPPAARQGKCGSVYFRNAPRRTRPARGVARPGRAARPRAQRARGRDRTAPADSRRDGPGADYFRAHSHRQPTSLRWTRSRPRRGPCRGLGAGPRVRLDGLVLLPVDRSQLVAWSLPGAGPGRVLRRRARRALFLRPQSGEGKG